ncbi:MAG: hypothetical protein IJN90_03055 [Bacilli bacterium]|nr:hypothetical protein [Bacilli bacterium]
MKKSSIKKLILTFVIGFFLSINMVFADDCSGLLTVEAADLIKEIVGYLRVGVPILLIILCSSDFVSVVTSQDDNAMKKAGSRIIKRFIAAAAFFFVPVIIEFILGIDAIKNSLNLVDDPTCGVVEDDTVPGAD